MTRNAVPPRALPAPALSSFPSLSGACFSVSVLALTLFLTLGAGEAQAQIYQYKDASGRTVISDVPPAPGTATDVKSSKTAPDAPAAATPAAPTTPTTPAGAGKTLADRELEAKKKQQEQQAKEEKAKREQETTAQNKENCDRARNSLGTLESGMRIKQRDDKGEQYYLDDAQRQQEAERIRKFIDESCKNS